jgi:ABC-type Fe3+-hydroxamate transport system substrate-binding protein
MALPTPTRYRLRDDLGDHVPLTGPPSRVVSLVPSLTEAIALTVPGVLAGATSWCTRPAGLDLPRVRGTKNPDLAKVGALRPDLVVANQEENRRVDVERLRRAGIAVWVTKTDGLDDALGSMERLFCEVFGLIVPPAWLTAARHAWSMPAAPAGRIAVPVWRDPWSWVGGGTYAGDLLARLGWENAVASLGDRYPRLEPETVLAGTPDVVLLPDEPYPFSAADAREVFPSTRTALAPGRALFWYGPAMVEARDILEAALA